MSREILSEISLLCSKYYCCGIAAWQFVCAKWNNANHDDYANNNLALIFDKYHYYQTKNINTL